IINKDPKELPKEMQSIHYQFQKANFYENYYRDMLITAKAAEKSGFTNRPEVKRMLEFMKLQYISQIYLMEEFEKRFKVTDEEVKAECEELRKKNMQLASRPISDCLNYARASLKLKYMSENQAKIRERIKEGISVKRNENFDLEEYLKNSQTSSKPESKP
ncbi:MAG: lipoprotein LipL31, partial [Leptospiraceae bacterium]|nr:lipoprotein LipL31 [Leptospiraceae bacterium]